MILILYREYFLKLRTAKKTALDRAEGLGNGYNETTLVFTDANNSNYQAQIYLADNNSIDNELRPNDWYKRFILTGATQNKLPQDYIDSIEAIVSIADPDKEREQRNLRILD